MKVSKHEKAIRARLDEIGKKITELIDQRDELDRQIAPLKTEEAALLNIMERAEKDRQPEEQDDAHEAA